MILHHGNIFWDRLERRALSITLFIIRICFFLFYLSKISLFCYILVDLIIFFFFNSLILFYFVNIFILLLVGLREVH